MSERSEEVNYKKNFCEKYFSKGSWDLDVLNHVDVLLKDNNENSLLYIEAKYKISNEKERKKALAQVILTNKKQTSILSRVAIIYQDSSNNDILELIDCSENSIMYNNDINWQSEKASSPTKDAIDRINDRISEKITVYINEEIKEFYSLLRKNEDTVIAITERNFNVVYNQWKNFIKFRENVGDEQDLINLFFVDILNGTKYKKSIYKNIEKDSLFGSIKLGEKEDTEQDLIREGTNLSNYKLMFDNEKIEGIKYSGKLQSFFYTISDATQYTFFWRKYKRPPEKCEFLKILERSATLYSDKYRRDTGGEYTPTCFVEKQNEILNKIYGEDWKEEYIVCDPCAGVGNLENQFGKDFKQHCYLSTLEDMDVDICKIKGFENAVQFDYLKDEVQPKWKYKGILLDIKEICRRENRKLMIVMNPPYQNVKGFKNNLAIEFFNKCLHLKPDVIVFYYMTESFLRSEIRYYINSQYKIASHIFSNAKITFLLSEWSISQIVFDKEKGREINESEIKADRYELEKGDFKFINSYTYDAKRPSLMDEIDEKIKKHENGLNLGNYSYMASGYSINLTNKTSKTSKIITTNNLKFCLLSKGLIFNTHNRYFERNQYVYKGKVEEIPEELICDAIIMALFYKNCAFTNKDAKNYIMPFTSEELGCAKNDLNVLFEENQEKDMFSIGKEPPFDFREFLKQFEFSSEAKNLYFATLEIFKYYHRSDEYLNKDWNDSFYDITNAIMGKNSSSFSTLHSENDKRINKTKTTKGTKGFGKNTIKYIVSSKDLPIFDHFFSVRDILAKKINKQLIENGLLLWERENIY